jgi:hypothetical protein
MVCVLTLNAYKREAFFNITIELRQKITIFFLFESQMKYFWFEGPFRGDDLDFVNSFYITPCFVIALWFWDGTS